MSSDNNKEIDKYNAQTMPSDENYRVWMQKIMSVFRNMNSWLDS
jgi:hypothetical protein